jgi:hypothetical protein
MRLNFVSNGHVLLCYDHDFNADRSFNTIVKNKSPAKIFGIKSE